MRPVPTLAALALPLLAAPALSALTIEDQSVSVGVKLQLQSRAQLLNDADNDTGGAYDPLRGDDGEAEAARFYLRRARLGLGATYGDWRGNLWFRAGEGSDLGSGTDSRNVTLFFANVARVFAVDGFTHDLHAGLDKPFNTESSLSSATYALPTERITSAITGYRGVGGGYGLRSPFVNVGVDVMNNSTGAKDADLAGETNGYFYSARLEVMPGEGLNPGKRQGSYLGKEGTHAVIGVDAQLIDANLTDDDTDDTYTITDSFLWGPDLLVHWNALTLLAEMRMRTVETEDEAGDTDSIHGRWFIVQAAYAFPFGDDQLIEPVVRYSVADSNVNRDNDEATYGEAPSGIAASGWYVDNGGDGTTIDLGLNWYLQGHNNKIQAAVQLWEAEEGDAQATIVRLQHQLAF